MGIIVNIAPKVVKIVVGTDFITIYFCNAEIK